MTKVIALTLAVLASLWGYAFYAHMTADSLFEWHEFLLLLGGVMTIIAVKNQPYDSELEPYDLLRRFWVAMALLFCGVLFLKTGVAAWKGASVFSILLVSTGVVWAVNGYFFRVQKRDSVVLVHRKGGGSTWLLTQGLSTHEVMQRARAIHDE